MPPLLLLPLWLRPGEDSVLIQSVLTGGGRGLDTVEMFTSEMMSRASCEGIVMGNERVS